MNSSPALLFAAVLALLPHGGRAADVIKANNTDTLNLGTSWVGGTAPGAADVAVWDNTVAGANTVALGANLSWAGLKLTNPGGLVTINAGSTLTLGSAGIDLSAATQNLAINANTTVGESQTWNIASGRTFTRSGATTTFGTGTTTTLAGGGTVTFGGTQALSGSGDITIEGATLFNNLQGGTQSRSGTTTLASGAIRIETSVSLFGTGSLALNGGAVGSGNATARVISNTLTVGGGFRVGGTGLGNGAVVFSGPVDLGGAVRAVEAVATGISTNNGSGAVFTGAVANGGLIKNGAGILTLNNNSNTFTGSTTVNAGSLAISQSALLNSTSVSLATTGVQLFLGQNGAGTHTLNNLSGVAGTSIRTDFTLSGTNANRSLTVNQSVDGEFAGTFVQGGSRAMEIVKTGPATLTLSGAGGHTLGTTISGGTLKIGGAGLLGSATYAGAITNNATLHFDSSASQSLTGTISGTGALLKSGAGQLTISGSAAAFTGPVTVSGGILGLNTPIGGDISSTGGRVLLNSAIGGNVDIASGGALGGTGSSTGDLEMTDGSTLVLTGGVTTTATQFDSVAFAGTVFLQFASPPDNGTDYDVVNYGAGGLTGFSSLTPLARGTLVDDTLNSKIVFTSGGTATRTWNTGSETWNALGTLQNWAEEDKIYYQGDAVVFGEIIQDTTITLVGLLSPSSIAVAHGANSYTFAGSGGLSGAAVLDKAGAGTLVIANPNDGFTGMSFVEAGVLRFVDGGTWGSGSISNNAAIEVNQSGNLALGGGITGTGTLTKTGTGILTISGANAYAGGTILGNGILRIGNNSALGLGQLQMNGGILSSDSGTTRSLPNNLILAANPAFGDGSNAGQLVFDGSVDLQGETRIFTSVLPTQGARFNGVISNGGITKAGTGRVTFANDANTFAGPTTINQGILATSTGALAASSSVSIATGGELALGSNGTTTIRNLSGATGSFIVSNFNISPDGARTLEVNQTLDGDFAGATTQGTNRTISLIKAGPAILNLSGSLTYTGTTTVTNGTLKISGTGALGAGSYGGDITNDATLHFDSSANQTLSGIVAGTGNLLKSNSGTLILTNNNDYAGTITIQGGTLRVGNNSTAGFIGNSATVVNNAAMVWHRSNDTNVGSAISGTGSLTKLGAAALNLNGASTYSGPTTVTTGTLSVNGSLGNTAVTVQTGATLGGNGNIGGNVTIQSGATHRLAVAATAGTQVTRSIGGALTLDAGNILTLTAAVAPANGTYILATASGGITGSPGTINLAPEITGTVSISGNNLILTVGGANDYDDWAGPSGFNLSQGPTGDDDNDGLTNFEEYAFGLNPVNPASVNPLTAPDKTAGTFTYTRRKLSLTGLNYTYKSSTTLAGWTAFTPPVADVSNNGDPVETITVTIPAALLTEDALFLRVEAVQP